MKIAYLDCPTGIAGDMCLGALIDLGVPQSYLSDKLSGLGLDSEYTLRTEIVRRNGQKGTKVHVDLSHHHHDHSSEHDHDHSHARHLPEIEALITAANLPPKAQDWSLKIFQQLAIAEGAVHNIPPEKVHFHEVGAVDAIVDIVGTCLGLDYLGVDQVYCSALPTGGGTVKAAHGLLPVPVPAVLKLWETRQVKLYSNGIEKELVTPTGAAIAVTLATSFGAPPKMQLERVGNGAGNLELALPNLLRIWLGTTTTTTPQTLLETISVLETQIDDLNPQAIGYTFDALFQAGALDVFTQAIGMKKSRPGILLTVICTPEKVADCEAIIFQETSTLGIRKSAQQRSILHREIHYLETSHGMVRVKIAMQGDKIVNVQPEYEDCAELAKKHSLPWRVIHQNVLATWYKTNPNSI